MQDRQPQLDLSVARSPGFETIPRADWDRAPWNRYAFHHVSELTPTERVWRGRGPASPLPEALQDLSDIGFTAEGQAETVGGLFGRFETDGLLVLSRGRIVAEHYFNGMRPEHLHLSQSVAKSVTGTVAGILIGRGVIDPEAPLTDHLPELARTGYRGATLRHVLDMTSGVAFNEDYTAPDSHMAMMDVACGWKDERAPGWPETMWGLIMMLTEQDQPHGKNFRYRSIETDVMAFTLQAATGKRLAELVSEELWQPLGEEDANFTVDRAGYALACGGFNATLRDYARFGRMLAEGGRVGDRQLVPEAWIAGIQAADPALFNDENRTTLPNGAYRNQFWLEEAGKPVFMARGVFGQMIYVDPAEDFVAVLLSSWPDFVNPARTRAVLEAFRAMRRHLREG